MSLAEDPETPGRFAGASLDRHVHAWDLETKFGGKEGQKPVASVYCKQRLGDAVWVPGGGGGAEEDEEDVYEEEEYE